MTTKRQAAQGAVKKNSAKISKKRKPGDDEDEEYDVDADEEKIALANLKGVTKRQRAAAAAAAAKRRGNSSGGGGGDGFHSRGSSGDYGYTVGTPATTSPLTHTTTTPASASLYSDFPLHSTVVVAPGFIPVDACGVTPNNTSAATMMQQQHGYSPFQTGAFNFGGGGGQMNNNLPLNTNNNKNVLIKGNTALSIAPPSTMIVQPNHQPISAVAAATSRGSNTIFSNNTDGAAAPQKLIPNLLSLGPAMSGIEVYLCISGVFLPCTVTDSYNADRGAIMLSVQGRNVVLLAKEEGFRFTLSFRHQPSHK